jgi:GDP-D-mannose 3', 5'-epimerase
MIQLLKKEGFWVHGVDLKFQEFSSTQADNLAIGDLRDQHFCASVVDMNFKEVFQFAVDMGGAGFTVVEEVVTRGDADALARTRLAPRFVRCDPIDLLD